MATTKKLPPFPSQHSRNQLRGSYLSMAKGSGLTYASSRPYVNTDSYNHIDRRTSAKKNELFLKQFEAEKQLRVLIVVPNAESMGFTTTPITKHQKATEITHFLFDAAIGHQDKIGFLVGNGQQMHFSPPSGQQAQCWKFDQAMEEYPPAGSIQINDYAEHLVRQHLKDHLIFWISDQRPSASDKRLPILARTNEILRIQLFDHFETTGESTELAKQVHLKSSTTHQFVQLDSKARKAYQAHFDQAQQQATKLLRSRHITTMLLETTDNVFKKLLHMFSMHRKTHRR